MLKKINKPQISQTNNKNLSDFKKLPKSKKVYIQSNTFKDVQVGMREISLEDKEIKDLIVYDTSGYYSDQGY